MKLELLLAGCVLILTSCSTNNIANNLNIKVNEGELLKEKWHNLERFPARYPKAAAMSNKMGCATVEYVITSDYKIKNLTVIEVSDKVFSKNAKKAIRQWKWSELQLGLIDSPKNTQTRFNFCIESKGVSCEEVIKQFSCSGADSLDSIGSIRKRSH